MVDFSEGFPEKHASAIHEQDSDNSETEVQPSSFFSQNPLSQFDGAMHTNKFGLGASDCQLNETIPQLT